MLRCRRFIHDTSHLPVVGRSSRGWVQGNAPETCCGGLEGEGVTGWGRVAGVLGGSWGGEMLVLQISGLAEVESKRSKGILLSEQAFYPLECNNNNITLPNIHSNSSCRHCWDGLSHGWVGTLIRSGYP